jgi:hypothetical protein
MRLTMLAGPIAPTSGPTTSLDKSPLEGLFSAIIIRGAQRDWGAENLFPYQRLPLAGTRR